MTKRNAMRFLSLVLMVGAGLALVGIGCQANRGQDRSAIGQINAQNAEHVRLYADFDPPRELGSVENVGLQLPAISPDGRQMLYLRSDGMPISHMTLFGSPDPRHTLDKGTLEIWLRPLAGRGKGRKVSRGRWAHSPVWADSGQTVAYVVNEPPNSYIVHLNLTDGKETVLGVPNAINCMPRFDTDDRTLLFCAGASAKGPFRVYRQIVGDREPIPMTAKGLDCLFPLRSDDLGRVLCARVDGEHLNWARCGPADTIDLVKGLGLAERPMLLQTWAGIHSPVSPDGNSIMFYDTMQERVVIYHGREKRIARHRPLSIAACWMTDEAIALATNELTFAVQTRTGMSLQILNGMWIPSRYVAVERRLILLGRKTPGRFSIVAITFKTGKAEDNGKSY